MKKGIKYFAVFALLIISIFSGFKTYQIYFLWENKLDIQIEKAPYENSTTSNEKYLEITPILLFKIKEISLLKQSNSQSGVMVLAESPNRLFLMSAHENGKMAVWDIPQVRINKIIDLGTASILTTIFDASGNLIATSGNFGNNGYKVIDTETGKIIDCEDSPECPDKSGITYDSQLLIPNGKALLQYDTDFRLIPEFDWSEKIDFEPTGLAGNCLFRSGFNDFLPSLVVRKTAISLSQKYIAYIVDSGDVCVKGFGEMFDINIETGQDTSGVESGVVRRSLNKRLHFKIPEKYSYPLDLKFDPTNRWLASITINRLIVWDLNNFWFPEKIDLPINGGKVLAFDRKGELLAAASSDKVIFIDLTSKRKTFEIAVGDVTAIYFSHDNKNLVLGDANGLVYIYAISSE